MKVRSKGGGYFGGQIKNEGMEFECSAQAFSPTWMTAIDKNGKALEVQPKKIAKVNVKKPIHIMGDTPIEAPVAPVQPETNAGPSDLI